LSFVSHGIHDVSATGENSLFWRVTGGRCGLAFHPLDAAASCIASCNSTTAFFLSTEASAFRGQLEEPKVRDFTDSQVLCGLVLCLVADPAERRGRHRTPYKLPLQ